MSTAREIARVCYEAFRGSSFAHHGNSMLPWEAASNADQDEMLSIVHYLLENPSRDAESIHTLFCVMYPRQQHVVFSDLHADERAMHYIVHAIVRAMSS